jgi:acetyl esterase/lipase
MPIGYLIAIGVTAAFTAIALAPPTQPPMMGRLAYLMTVVVNEVPHLAVGLPLASATLQTLAGDRVTFGVTSVSAFVAAAAVFAGLGVLAARGIRGRDAVSKSLREAGVAPMTTPRAWAVRVALTPLPIRPRRVVREANLRYGTHRRQRLDVYHRRDRPSGGSVLVYLHGGGYYSGSKHHEGRALLHQMAERGWVCVSASYRLRPHAGFEDHLDDARSALAWAREHAAEYGGDASTLVMAGSSAGAHLSSLLALEPGSGLSAVICLYGYYERYYGRTPDEPVTSSPFALPAAGAPPWFLAHGDHDTWTPASTARRLTEKLREESGNPVVGIELPGGQHGFDLVRSWRYSAVLDGIDAFLADHRVGITTSRHSSAPTGVE